MQTITATCESIILTCAEAALLLGTTVGALTQGRAEGRGPTYIRIGKDIRYLREVVVAYAEAEAEDGWMTAEEVAKLLNMPVYKIIEASEQGTFIRGEAYRHSRRYRRKLVMKYLRTLPTASMQQAVAA